MLESHIRSVSWKECHCPCHEPGSGVIHMVACCAVCVVCGKNIESAMSVHMREAHPEVDQTKGEK